MDYILQIKDIGWLNELKKQDPYIYAANKRLTSYLKTRTD